jgi:hypothetical protein
VLARAEEGREVGEGMKRMDTHDHHYRAWGYCPYCREHLNTTSRQVMNPPSKDEAGNLANTAPLQADHDAQRRGIDSRVIVAGGRQPVTDTAAYGNE